MTKKEEELIWETQIIEALPDSPPEYVERFEEVNEELGPPMIIYKRESRTPQDWESIELLGLNEEIKYHWTATCTCTECGEEFFAPWGKESFYVVIGEDNETYVNFFSDEESLTTEIREGDSLFCPNCGEECIAVPANSVRNGRTYRTQAASLENINGTTVLVYWLYSRYLSRKGYEDVQVEPREAIAVSPAGKLVRFSHMSRYMNSESYFPSWQKRTTVTEPELIMFKSEGWNKVGSMYIPFSGDMSGTTGEKTGIDAYWRGAYPSVYLRTWRKHRNIENLARSGADELLSEMIHRATNTYTGNVGVDYAKLDKLIMWDEKRPHKMLGLRKDDYRRICANGWTAEMLNTYREYMKTFPETTAGQFEEYEDILGIEQINGMKGIWSEGLGRIIRYLEKQALAEHTERMPVQLFKDYRNMMYQRNMYAELGELTQAELYPPNLRRAHDRIAREHNEWLRRENMQRQQNRHLGDMAIYGEQFEELYRKYSALAWSDGEICIVVPESPADLIREGHILNHCVGGYSSQHCSGRPIFFVRHARCPERSWFTLNENLTGESPKQIQLHGYGNEHAHGRRLTIPKNVLDFVDKWEREILAPWFEAQKKIKTAGKETAA